MPRPPLAKAEKLPWPASLAEQAAAVRSVLTARTSPAGADDIAAGFKRAKRERVAELLETLASLGQARKLADDRYAAA